MSSCSHAFCHKEQHIKCRKAQFSQGRKHFGTCQLPCRHRFLGALGTISRLPTVGTSRKFLQFLPDSAGSDSLVVDTKYCSTKCAKTWGVLSPFCLRGRFGELSVTEVSRCTRPPTPLRGYVLGQLGRNTPAYRTSLQILTLYSCTFPLWTVACAVLL